jgi:hypothetical protein
LIEAQAPFWRRTEEATIPIQRKLHPIHIA